MKSLLITGGAGFVGSSLAILFKRYYEDLEVICLDNLSRKGSELNLPRLKAHGIHFVHGDVRNSEDLNKLNAVDWLIECSAEPSVHAGFNESPAYLINTNLNGLINCLEFLRQKGGNLIFLSTSRVYPIKALRDLPLKPQGERLVLQPSKQLGLSAEGISEAFTLEGARSLYGTTKLSGEHFIQEYCQMYHLKAVINRCGVLAGPWQMGKVDQGFMALWVAMHYFEGALNYMGFGGEGLQVRDVLHVEDLFYLLRYQMQDHNKLNAPIYNVGGGIQNSVSLRELTALVKEVTKKKCNIGSVSQTKDADIPYYVTDNSKVMAALPWQPQISVSSIVEQIYQWLHQHSSVLESVFQP
ncbi:MAG: NAD-dependent epimerase/dehydratase family protein [Proteobacteria bacterium]|nr:NAD-dependent epimerase/dehydratase family protein [Pseudomonadota bacterium]